jgi:dsRNA-specific ribonuclease
LILRPILSAVFQEWHQQQGLPVPEYNEVTEKRAGLPHSPCFTYQVSFDGGSFPCEGTRRTVTEAKQAAAKKALEKIERKV